MPNPSRFVDLRPGESVRERVCRVVRDCAGMSLSSRRDELEGLVARGVDDPTWAREVVLWATNCGTSALGVIASACGSVEAAAAVHALLARRSVNGMSIAWLMQIGRETGAWTPYRDGGPQPKAGDLLRYQTPNKNDDHVEWLLEPIDARGSAEHGGGGRPGNAISVGRGPVLTSAGRPLAGFLDLDKLALPESLPLDPTPPVIEPLPPSPDPTTDPEPGPAPEPDVVDPPAVVVPPSPAPARSSTAWVAGVAAAVLALLTAASAALAHCGH